MTENFKTMAAVLLGVYIIEMAMYGTLYARIV